MAYTYEEPRQFKLRAEQRQTIETALRFFDAGKKAVIIVAPTGSGKSVMARTIASAFDSGYLLTPTKILQDQYANDFCGEDGVKLLKGKSNYFCGLVDASGGSEAIGVDQQFCQDVGAQARAQRKECRELKQCPYYNALDEAAESRLAIMNFRLFMVWMMFGPLMDAPPFIRRDIHVVDECHGIDANVSDFLGISMSWETLEAKFAMYDADCFDDLPDDTWKEPRALEFLRGLFALNVKRLASLCVDWEAADAAELLLMCETSKAVKDDAMFYLELDKKLKYMFEMLARDPASYGIGVTGINHRNPQDTRNLKVIAQPVDVSNYMRSVVMGDHTLFLSATIPDPHGWAEEIGLRSGEYGVIDMPSSFPAANRPIRFETIGEFNRANKHLFYGGVTEKIVEIAGRHQDAKGIIHAPSYEWCEEIEKRAPDDLKRRLLVGRRRELKTAELMQKHENSEIPTILLSPAMKEGVDLKDDLSRFQVVVKCPFADLSNPRVAKKAMRGRWYHNDAICSFMQQTGRSVRSPTDWAVTYCLDGKLANLVRRHRGRLPRYFQEALVGL